MDALVTALTGTGGVSVDTLFGALADAAPLLIIGLTVGFSLTIVRRVIGGLGRGKAKI
jgi:hypothetical protein